MTLKLKILAVLTGISLFLYIIELVRQRRLREEYAWLWLLTGSMIVVLSLWYDLLLSISIFLGGILPSAVLFFSGMIFLLFISLYQSVKISRLTDQVKTLSQEMALMDFKKENKENKI
jgi:hypothetical protein